MSKWRTSAAYRIALANFSAFIGCLALLGIIIFVVMHAAFLRQLDAMIEDEAEAIVAEYQTGGSAELAEDIHERDAILSPGRMSYAVFAPNGNRFLGKLVTQRPAPGFHDIEFTSPAGERESARILAIDLSPRERLVVAADRKWIERIDETIIAVFLFAFVAVCLLTLGGAALLGAYFRERLDSISGAAEAITRGDIRERMPVSARHDEFDELSSTLNGMLDRIEGLLDNLRQISNDVAHDLRTPLARLRTQLESGLTESSGDLSTIGILENSISQIDEILSLFGAILRIAEVESGETKRLFTEVDLSNLLTEIAESYSPAFQDEGSTLLWYIDENVTVRGDRELIVQAVINLLENALRHTPCGTRVRLTLTACGTVWHLQVSDNGPGVPPGEFDRITKRFVRLDRSRGLAGYGLGLNLVSAVANLHGGRLILKDAAPGLVAIIELPRALHQELFVPYAAAAE